MSWTQDELNV